ncbi:LCP family protein [Defluviitalea phaphyphila]|uniref:LCP family protein n=1 Tax=Defluviitalea phaphyphila TaxID=1473580 RepID=UPI0007308768|nr:LCP family protein [Defluviitalea phaphyphila]
MKKDKKIFLFSILGVFMILTIVLLKFINLNFKTLASSIEEDVVENNVYESKEDVQYIEEKINVEEITGMIIGMDKSKGLTDVVMVAKFDPSDSSIKLISIPRDLYINFDEPRFSSIKEKNKEINIGYCKLTELYNYTGRNEKSIEIIEEVVQVIIGEPIDYYVKVDLEGFKAIIDVIGGVEVDIPKDMHYDDYSQDLHIHLEKGLQLLDGEKAEQLVRYRHGYVDGDFGRIRMQQMLLKNLGEKVLEIRNPIKIFELVKEAFKYVETDFTIVDGIKYIKYLLDIDVNTIFKEENMVTIPTNGEKIGGLWYEVQDEEKTKEILDELL